MKLALRSSLAGRVALASALAAALGGSVAALSTGITARELVSKHEKKNLKAAARELADEVRDELEELAEPDDDDEPDEHAERVELTQLAVHPDGERLVLTKLLAHELGDVKLPSATAVIRRRGQVIVGDARLPFPERGDCDVTVHLGTQVRACTVAMGNDTLTLVVNADDERDRSALIVQSLWVGLLAGALLGGLFSYFVSRWALSPLLVLRDRVRALPVDDADPARLGGVAAQVEVEELRAAIAQLVERLGAALQQAEAFSAEAAHELRTPLTTIGGELDLIAEQTTLDKVALSRVRTQVAALTGLVQRLLVLAQPRRVHAERGEVVDLSDVVEAAQTALSATERARLVLQVADDVIVRGDGALLRALLVNAVGNALKFSTGPVEVHIRADDQVARIDVIDDGPGIAASERERVFVPFYRSPEARASGASGHGIGLSLIARVAWQHDGKVELVERAHGTHLSVT
ncbi:MAG: hypothetical protein RLZZ450_2373, partial [Pseudomonadota bacterium]